MIKNANSGGATFLHKLFLVHPESNKAMLKISDTIDFAESSKKAMLNCSYSHKSLIFPAASGQFLLPMKFRPTKVES